MYSEKSSLASIIIILYRRFVPRNFFSTVLNSRLATRGILTCFLSLSCLRSSLQKFDLGKVKRAGLDFAAPFTLTMQQDATCHVSQRPLSVDHLACSISLCVQGLVGYFDIGFDVGVHSVHISTSPQDVPTHWKQTVFYFKEPFSVCTGWYSDTSPSVILPLVPYACSLVHALHLSQITCCVPANLPYSGKISPIVMMLIFARYVSHKHN